MPIKIIITDDHPLVVSGLKAVLKETDEISVMATCTHGEELLELLQASELPDVLLIDLHMPGKVSGKSLIRTLKQHYPKLPILVLSGEETLYNVREVMEAGSNGYLLKNSTDILMLMKAIYTVYNGALFLEPALKDDILRSVLRKQKEQEHIKDVFTRRQVEIIKLLSEGFSSQQIAGQLHLSVRTVESHRHRLMQKLNTNNVTGLLKKANELGLIG